MQKILMLTRAYPPFPIFLTRRMCDPSMYNSLQDILILINKYITMFKPTNFHLLTPFLLIHLRLMNVPLATIAVTPMEGKLTYLTVLSCRVSTFTLTHPANLPFVPSSFISEATTVSTLTNVPIIPIAPMTAIAMGPVLTRWDLSTVLATLVSPRKCRCRLCLCFFH